MRLKRLSLLDFRNYPKAVFDLDPGLNLIVGPNAVGKSNILEAVYLLATGQSFRASRNEQIISWGKPVADIKLELGDGSQLKLLLSREGNLSRKVFSIDGVKKTRKQFLEVFSAVIFRPEEIRIISGSPTRRREFIDKSLSPLSWQYQQSSRAYQRAQIRRNKILLAIKEGKSHKQELYFWDQTLVKNGQLIQEQRQVFFDFVNSFLTSFQSGRFKHLQCRYQPSIVTKQKLENNLNRDLMMASTGIGPHRDDFAMLDDRFGSDRKDLSFWGSRGQQRLAILALKLAQLEFVEKQTSQKPVLLLDDIFSELDKEGEKLVLSVLDDYQTLLTSTDEIEVANAKVLRIK
ncbi:MAG: DNA replication and repair protein RecF [Patescibacteria group bacterium]